MSAIAPIAIVGRGCVLPGALDPGALWRLVVEGRDAIGAAPPTRWRVPAERALCSDPKDSADRAWSDRGGYVHGFAERFDPAGFALDATRVAALDPLYRWTLHAGREAFREAGLERGRTGGVILGNLSFPTAAHAAFAEDVWLGRPPSRDPIERFHSGLPARLLATSLGLDDVGSYCLDAACASSLYAIALACDALTDRRADVMLAGAVNCTDDLFIHVGFSALGALSRSGRSRPFHPDADGLLPGEGAAVVALMRLDDAVAEGRRVLGVIRGVGLANDGRARGFLAPAEDGQRRAMRQAYDAAGLSPSDVAWIECHATGTQVGDATEIASTAAVFDGCADVPIGSLKANLGHLITAAGAAGLLKVLGALDAGVRPPTPHLDRVTDALRDTPLRVVREPEPWSGPRRAAVSAFGFGGNDAHLIVESPEETRRVSPRAIAEKTRAKAPRREELEPPLRLGALARDRFSEVERAEVERAEVERAEAVPSEVEPAEVAPLAIVGIGVRVGDAASAEAFADALETGRGGRRAREVVLPLDRMRTPPADLEAALAQQTMILAAALDAVPEGIDPARTSVLIGMQCDAEIARYGVRWRLPEDDPRRDGFAPVLQAAGVLGTMPNIPANRLNAQLDARGPSFTVSADELSGVRALEIAARALRVGDIDAAVVGAVDLACEPVHERARSRLGDDLEDRDAPHRGGDAAVILVLQRLADARAASRPVLATLSEGGAAARRASAEQPTYSPSRSREGVGGRAAAGRASAKQPASSTPALAPYGDPHAATGLLQIAVAALSLHRDDAAEEAVLDLSALGGSRARVVLHRDPETPPGAVPLRSAPPRRALSLSAHPPPPPVAPSSDALPRPPTLPPVADWSARPPAVDDEARMDPAPRLGSRDGARVGEANGVVRGPHHRADAGAPTQPAVASPFGAAATPLAAPSTAGETAHRATPDASATAAVSSLDAWRASVTADPVATVLVEQHRRMTELHQEFLARQAEIHRTFMEGRERALRAFGLRDAVPDPGSETDSASGAASVSASDSDSGSVPVPVSVSTPEHGLRPPSPQPPPASGRGRSSVSAPEHGLRPPSPPPPPPSGRGRGLLPATPAPVPSGRTFDRAALETHASGRISEIFGSAFAAQDAHAVQVRMPEPPLLLADRVTGLVGVPATMGKGSVWTETDVTADAWYLANGRMPAGLMIESGQADLFLISWLGADLLNRGERAYRLLGCTLTWHRSPPRVGETLAYDIHVDGHARQGDVRLFFFHYDCHIDGEPALTVRSGQAGFFTRAELDASAGVLWSPDDHTPDPDARVDPPAVEPERCVFEDAHLAALAAGDVVGCFGEAYRATRAHVRTPTIAAGDMRFLERVTDFDPTGGPWRRGYLKAVTRIHPDDWYFAGHFKNDPCMPGTLMLEGCLQAMAFHLVGLGYTLDRDGWRFEPVTGETYEMICRGQVVPTSRELTYEVFVEEVHDGPVPKLYADLLCTVDGLQAFHARRFGLALVPDAPLSSHPELLGRVDPEPVATLDGVALGADALMHSAWGTPSRAFGPAYAIFDGPRRAPRLPGPPYHMVSRVTAVEGAPWQKKPGASVEIAYDVPPDAWYFGDGGSGAMPFALLMEAALQPCGWLATYVGSTVGRDGDLRFRNLDGEGEILAEVRPEAGTLRTRATLTSISDTASMIIVAFDVVTRRGDVDVYRLRTTFGFFPDAAFEGQPGLPVEPHHRAARDAVTAPIVLADRTDLFEDAPRLCRGRLRLLDVVTHFDPEGGRAGLGAARAERDVDPGEWFFRAHFFEDPVQPGSLGLEAMLQLLRFVVREKGLADSMRAPRFTPIATGAHRWKYRGQVRPDDGRIAVTLELTALDRDEARVRAEAECSFWIDDKRIYEATIALELVDDPRSLGAVAPSPVTDAAISKRDRASAGARSVGWPRDAHPARDVLRDAWRAHIGVGPWLGEDLVLALVDRFVGEVRPTDTGALDRLRGRPALYLANHQTAIETLMLSVIAGAYGGVPLVTVAKAEHRGSWYGELLAWLFRYPGIGLEELTAYFDRDDPAALPALLRGVRDDRSVLLHVEGTRATSCRAPIARMSGVPIDVAAERGLPIVPVRFRGGLPVEPADDKLDFPLGMARQDVVVGAPISPDALPATYADRVAIVRDALEALRAPDEIPNASDLAFEERVAALAERRGVSRAHAVLLEALRDVPDPSDATRRLLAAADGARLAIDGARAEDRWLAPWAARLFG